MIRTPLVLSAQHSAGRPETRQDEASAAALALSCTYCGLSSAGGQETTLAGLVIACCALCTLSLHLERRDIDREATLIWLPEISQGGLNTLTRNIHLVCHAAGLPVNTLATAPAPPGPTKPGVQGARVTYRTLLDRKNAAMTRLGTSSPHELGQALLALPADQYTARSDLLAGTRVLSLGAVYRNGTDIYPPLLSVWAAAKAARRSPTA